MAVQLRGINLGKKTKIIAYLLSVTLLFFIVAKLIIYQNNKYITVGSTTYSRQQYSDYKKYLLLQQIGSRDVDKQIVERLRLIEFARQSNISLDGEQLDSITNQLKKTTPDKQKNGFGDAYKLDAKYVLINKTIYNPRYQGYYYEFYFGQHISFSDKNKPEGLNDPKLIAQDRNYAKQRAEYYRNSISKGAIEPDQALNEILKDPKLGNNKILNNYSTKIIDTPEALYNDSAKDLIYSSSWKGLSDIKLSAIQVEPGVNKPKKDMYYYFVYLIEAPSLRLTTAQINDQIAKISTSYN